jgi:hypothetical protein
MENLEGLTLEEKERLLTGKKTNTATRSQRYH